MTAFEEMWSEKDLSERYRIPVETLRYWRKTRTVLPFHKIGRLVRYEPSEVMSALKAVRVG